MPHFRRPDGIIVTITNPDVIAKQLKEGFVPCEAPEVTAAREAAERERLKAELRAELEAEMAASAAQAEVEVEVVPSHGHGRGRGSR